MYVQPTSGEQASLQVPRDYSGNAFAPPSMPQMQASSPPPPSAPPPPHEEMGHEEQSALQAQLPDTEETVPTGGFLHHPPPQREGFEKREREDRSPHDGYEKKEREHRSPHGEGERTGILGRFPFLSSLLPPSRGKGGRHERGGGHSDLVEWAIIGLALLLFLEDSTDDILPLLLLLLLWD